MSDPGTVYGDARLNIKVTDTAGNVDFLYTVTEENGPVQVKCRACDVFIDGDVTDISKHENAGGNHKRLLTNGRWQLYGHNDEVKITNIKQERGEKSPSSSKFKIESNYVEKGERSSLFTLVVCDSKSRKSNNVYVEMDSRISCTVCDISFDKESLLTHHKKTSHWYNFNLEKWIVIDNKIQFTEDELSELLDLDGSKVFFDDASPAQKRIEENANSAIVGSEYIIEIQDVGNRQKFKAKCLLCDKVLNQSEICIHLVSPTHRLKFLSAFFPTVRRKFMKVPSLKYWQPPAFTFLESVANSIQNRFGKNKVLSIASEEYFNRNSAKIKAMIEYGQHATESDAMNFATIPDPFGSFIKSIPPEHLLKMNPVPPIKMKSGVALVKEYQNLDAFGTGTDNLLQPKINKKKDLEIEELLSKNLEKNFTQRVSNSDELEKIPGTRTAHMDSDEVNKKSIMERISNLKKNLREESDFERRIQFNQKESESHTDARIKDPYKGLDKLLADDPAALSSKDLKGIHIGKGYNRDRKTMKYNFNPTNPTNDKDEQDRDVKPFNVKKEYDDSRGWSKKSYNEKRHRRSSRSRSKSRERSDERPKKWRGDSSGKKSADTGMNSEEEREHRARIEARLGPSPTRRVVRKRSRSKSPYVVAMETWDKFKRAEGVLLTQLETKRKFFMKRPEDHPDYAQEWKAFWKRRYGEIVAKGLDPNTHDFKKEWIPFWEKRMVEIFDEDLKTKVEDLMQKLSLTSVEKPKREDYKEPTPEKRVVRMKRSPSPDVPARRQRDEHSPRQAQQYQRSYHMDSPSPPPRRSPTRRSKLPHALPPPKSAHRKRSPEQGPSSDDHLRWRQNAGGSPTPPWGERRGGRDMPPAASYNDRSQRRGGSRERMRWNPSPPGQKYSMGDRGQTGPSRIDSQRSDLYSGITELEDRRDRGRTRSRTPPHRGSLRKSMDYHKRDEEVNVTSVLRILSALEDSLGSLGPALNKILAKSLSLEQSRPGTSGVMLEDPDIVSVLDMVKEKLSGQVMAGLLTGSKEGAVRVSLDNLTLLLQKATKKRSTNPLESLMNSSSSSSHQGDGAATKPTPSSHFRDTQAVNKFLANAISTVLVCTKRTNFSDQDLEELVAQLMSESAELTLDQEITKVAKDFTVAVQLEKDLKAKAERAEWARRIERADLIAREKEYENRYTDNSYFNRRPEPVYYPEERLEEQPLHTNPPPPVETICLDDDDGHEGDRRREESRYHGREDSEGMREHLSTSGDRMREHSSTSGGRMRENSSPSGDRLREHTSASGDRMREHTSASGDRMREHTSASGDRMQEHTIVSGERMREHSSARSDTGARSVVEVDTHATDEHQDEEGEDFTVDELKSLLANFEYLSRSEQTDLMNYVRKLERRKPEVMQVLRPLLDRINS